MIEKNHNMEQERLYANAVIVNLISSNEKINKMRLSLDN